MCDGRDDRLPREARPNASCVGGCEQPSDSSCPAVCTFRKQCMQAGRHARLTKRLDARRAGLRYSVAVLRCSCEPCWRQSTITYENERDAHERPLTFPTFRKAGPLIVVLLGRYIFPERLRLNIPSYFVFPSLPASGPRLHLAHSLNDTLPCLTPLVTPPA